MKIFFTLVASLVFFFNAASQTIKVSEFGFNEVDATAVLKTAILSPYDTIVIDVQKTDWILGPMTYKNINNKTIVFEPGVIVRAKKGAFKKTSNVLFRFENSENVRLIGHDTQLLMNKSEYTDGEWRHCISFRSCKNMEVSGFTIIGSGGDGIYLAGTSKGTYCKNIKINDVKSINNKRQGISIISAVDVLIKNSVFRDTKGTPPGAGVDIEPNSKDDRIKNIVFDNCIFSDNYYGGIVIGVGRLEKTSEPISISFKNCVLKNNFTKGNPTAAGEIIFSAHKTNPVKGEVVFEDCLVDGSLWGLFYGRKISEAFTVTFKNCIARDICKENVSAAMYLEVPDYRAKSKALGGFVFDNLVLEYEAEVPFFLIRGSSLGTLSEVADIKGDVTIISSMEKKAEYINYSSDQNRNVSIHVTQKKPKK